MFEIRKNLDLRKNLVIPKIFLKSRFHCIGLGDQLLFISFDVKVKKFMGASGKGWAESVHLGWNSVN